MDKSRSEDGSEAKSHLPSQSFSITAMEVELYTTALSVLCGCQEQTLVIRHTAITLPTEPSPQAATLFFGDMVSPGACFGLGSLRWTRVLIHTGSFSILEISSFTTNSRFLLHS